MVRYNSEINPTQEVNATMSTESFPYHLTDASLTFYVEGRPTQVLRDHPFFDQIVKAVEAGDPEAVTLAKPINKVVEALAELTADTDSAKYFRRKAGVVEVTDWGVTLNGQALHGHVIDRLMDVLRSGLSITPWVNFVRKLHQNPSSVSRDELYLWLEKADMPITPDGDFLAYKRVRADYRDIHSGKFDNSVGKVVEMSRLDVDDDRRRTCSAGLHFCSKSYLPHFSSNGSKDHVMVVKINPADVVSIPADYNDAKGRTWRYEVVGEITLEEAGLHVWDAVSYDYGDDDDTDWSDYYDYDDSDPDDAADDVIDDADAQASRELIGKVFAQYAARFGVSNSKGDPEREVRLMRARYALGYTPNALSTFSALTVGEAQDLITAWS